MIFWIIVAALLALALLILLLPMMRATRVQQAGQRQQQNIEIAREKKQLLEKQLADGEIDQVGFDAAYLDLQTSLALELGGGDVDVARARGKWMMVVVFLLVPIASISLYLKYGEYRVIDNPAIALAQAPRTAQNAPVMSLEEMVTTIKNRLRQNPEDAEGWFMLGRAMMGQQRYDEAVTAYQRSNDLMADEPGIMFSLADALAMQNNGNMLGEPEELVLRGLALAPRFPNGLWLAGMAAEQRQDLATAHRYWTQLLPLIRDDMASVLEVERLIAMLEEREPGLASKVKQVSSGLNLRVDISAELKARSAPDAAVFVYAKAMQGPPMPLAVKKLQLADLPVSLNLGDEDAMMPNMKLSLFDQVIVGARVSSSGKPVAQAGDFFIELDSIDSNNPPEQILLTIDQIKQ